MPATEQIHRLPADQRSDFGSMNAPPPPLAIALAGEEALGSAAGRGPRALACHLLTAPRERDFLGRRGCELRFAVEAGDGARVFETDDLVTAIAWAWARLTTLPAKASWLLIAKRSDPVVGEVAVRSLLSLSRSGVARAVEADAGLLAARH